VFIVLLLNKLLFTKIRLKMAEHFWMTPILLPFPEDSDGLLTFKRIIVLLLPRFLKRTLWKRLNFGWVQAKLVRFSDWQTVRDEERSRVPTTSDRVNGIMKHWE